MLKGRKERYRVNLINRSKALQDIVEYADKITTQRYGWEELRRVAWDIYRIVASQPTVEVKYELPEIVRCEDCKYSKFIDFGLYDCKHEHGLKHTAARGFCGYGKRREET